MPCSGKEKNHVAVGARPLVTGVLVSTLRNRCSGKSRVSGEVMIAVLSGDAMTQPKSRHVCSYGGV